MKTRKPKPNYWLALRLELLLIEKRKVQGDYVVFNAAQVCRQLGCRLKDLGAAIIYLQQPRAILAVDFDVAFEAEAGGRN